MLVLSFIWYKSFPVAKETRLLIVFFYLVFSFLVNFKSAQTLSFVYSFFFIFSYLFYSAFMKGQLTRIDYRYLLKIVFVFYFIGLVAGQLLLNFDLFIPVTISGNSVHGLMGILLEPSGFRFYSLSSEPSYAAFIVVVLFYSYAITDPKGNTLFMGENALLFILLVYMILMFKSAYGIILIAALIVGQYGFNRKAVLVYSLVPLVLLLLALSDYNFEAFDRVVIIIKELDVNNLHTLSTIDFTSYYRLAPFLYYFESANWMDPAFYFGHGASASKLFIVPEIYLAYPNGEFSGGFLPSYLYDYGVIGSLLVVFFIFHKIKLISIPSLVIVLMLLNANFNTQLFWFLIFCFSMNQHFNEQAKREVVVVQPLT